MTTRQSDSCMAPIDYEDPFLGKPFEDAFDVDVWNEEDARDAFNPFDHATTGFPKSFAPESAVEVSTTAILSSDNHRTHEKVLRHGGVKKPSSLRRLSGRSKQCQDENASDSYQAESNEISTRTVRSHKSNSSSESEHGAVNQDKNLDRRTRIVRNPNASSKLPTRQRSLPSKEKSLHNLVSLLNSSMNSIEDESLQADTAASSTDSSKSSCIHKSDEQRSEKIDNEIDNGRSHTPTRDDQVNPRMKSRQTLKANLTVNGKQALSPDVKQTAITSPSRDFQGDGSRRRGMNVDETHEPKQPSFPKNRQGSSTRSPIRGIQKPPSFRSRRKSLDNLAGDLNQAENQVEPPLSGHVPSRGLNKTQSMTLRRSFRGGIAADLKQTENTVVEQQPSKIIPVRNIQKSESLRLRRTQKADTDEHTEKPVSIRHTAKPVSSRRIPNTAPVSSPDGGGIPPRGLQRAHSTNLRQKVVRSRSMDGVDLTNATRVSPEGDTQRPPRPLSGGIKPVRRAKSALVSASTSG